MPLRPDELPEAMRGEVRALAELVHERLLAEELAKLDADFGRWRKRELNSFELESAIHRFQEGLPRQLWLRFNTNQMRVLLQRVEEGLASGVLREAELSEELLAQIKQNGRP